MAEERVLSGDEQLRLGREQFESATDFTVAVEEEFAILDPETLSLTDGFEQLKAAAEGTELEPHLVGELIASEVEVRTGRCETFADAARARPQAPCPAAASSPTGSASRSARPGAHPWSPWQEQRIIDTPHYRRPRRAAPLRRLAEQHVRPPRPRCDPRRRIARCEVCDALRAYLPELLALSASSPFLEHVNTGLHSVRTQIFTRFFPRCGMPDVYGDWRTFEDYVRFLFDTGSIQEHTEMWWSVRPHLAFPTVEIRICDAQPLEEEAISLAAFAYSLTARIARALDEGEELLDPPNREIEENFWRAIRWGLSRRADRPSTHEVRPARAAIEELIEWMRPVAEELGAAEYLPCRRRTRPSGRSRASRRARRSRRSTRSRCGPRRRSVAEEGELSQEELLEHIRQLKVSDLLLSILPTVAQLGYAKLEPGRPRPRAGEARDRVAARARPGPRRLGARGGRARLRAGDREPAARLREGGRRGQKS